MSEVQNMPEEIYGNIYDIQKFSVHDGPGIRTDVFTKGCPLRCLWCHSPESQEFGPDLAWMDIRCIGTSYGGLCINACDKGALSAGEPVAVLGEEGKTITQPVIDRTKCDVCLKCASACPSKALYNTLRHMSVEEVMTEIRKDIKYYNRSGGGVTISGGEPMSQFEFTLALAKQCRAEGIHVALDTTGFAPWEHFEQILPYINLFLFDLKHMDSKRSEKLVGVPNELILDNARKIAAAGGRFQFRFPIIPKLNDSEENVRATAAFCKELVDAIDVVQLLPYHKLGEMKYIRLGRKYKLVNVEPPTQEFMEAQLEIFKSYGVPSQIS